MNPDWTAEVSKLRALEDNSKTEISSGITALPANHKDVQQNWANTITGNIREGTFKNELFSYWISPVSLHLAK